MKQICLFVYSPNAAEEDWQILASLFPSGWQEQARRSGAIERRCGITSPETLLRLHLGRGYSLREMVVRARQAGLASISGVGLLQRLQRSVDWLHWLCTRLLAENGVDLPDAAAETKLRLVALLTQKLVRIGRELSPWGHLVRH